MKPWQWAILILALILVIFFIIFGRNIVDYRYSYGTWATRTSSCTPNGSGSCSLPGTAYQETYCIPDPKTRRGCIGPGGVQTYTSTITEVPCALQCQKYKWDVDIGDCNPLTGFQHVTYTCVVKDTQGINGCTTAGLVDFNGGQYQDVTTYTPGQVVEWDIKCLLTSSGGSGGTVAAITAHPLPPPPSRNANPNPHYTLEVDCDAEHPFQEGVAVSLGKPCRAWRPDQLYVFSLMSERGPIVPISMPHSPADPDLPWRNWPADRADRGGQLVPIALVALPNRQYMPGYSSVEHLKHIGALFFFFPTQTAKIGKIACLLGTGHWGWLATHRQDSGRVEAYWKQAAFRPGSPGLSWAEAETYEILSQDGGSSLEIRTRHGLQIFLKQVQKGAHLTLTGIPYPIHPDIDLSFRLDHPVSHVYRDYLF